MLSKWIKRAFAQSLHTWPSDLYGISFTVSGAEFKLLAGKGEDNPFSMSWVNSSAF